MTTTETNTGQFTKVIIDFPGSPEENWDLMAGIYSLLKEYHLGQWGNGTVLTGTYTELYGP